MTASLRNSVALTAALLIAITPLAALAQVASSTSLDSAGTTPTQRAQLRGWRQANQFQQQISVLPGVAVQVLPMPVLFGVAPANLTPNFGDPRDGGTRTHEGEDIMAVKGTPIVSPTEAVVLRTVTGVDEGNAVYTANPGGETFVYMHLDRFGEGVSSGTVLHPGSLIGYVGNTGNASGGAAHLHFEIHDSSGNPTNPYPRLTAEFTPAEKISYLTVLLGIASDPVALSQFLVTNFRAYFAADASIGIVLPPLITGALESVPVSTNPAPAPVVVLPTDDLDLGSSGSAVVSLQTFLINRAVGPAATRLAQAGATGNFGPITQAALVEYQSSVGIAPANGYYGPATRAKVEAGSGTTIPPVSTPSTSTLVLTRNLYNGVSGQDVLALQQFLNAHGFTVASNGAGSLGNETTYFGPATLAAVVRFQIAHSIEPSVGYVGVITRSALAAL